jgi:hypothetical protein
MCETHLIFTREGSRDRETCKTLEIHALLNVLITRERGSLVQTSQVGKDVEELKKEVEAVP